MKKILCSLLSACIIIGSFSGCMPGISKNAYDKVVSENNELRSQINELTGGTDSSNAESSMESSSEKPTGKFDADTVISQLGITTYEYTNSIGTHWVVVAIKNNSEFNLEISMDGQFKDANGTLIGTSKDEDPAFEKGSEIAFTFNNEAEYASFEYKISVKETDYYDCVWSNIQVESNTAEKKAIISATNNGEKPAEFLEYIVVFFNGGTPVDHTSGYLVDDESELKPGQTESREADCYVPFDSIKVFYNARASKF